jgi:hypothetical protein
MKPVTVDMLRAHLMAASLTAMAIEVLTLLALLVLPVSQQAFSSTPFQLVALTVIVGGVTVIRHSAHVAFDMAVQCRHVIPYISPSRPVSVAANFPRRWLVILHLRFNGRPFVAAEH